MAPTTASTVVPRTVAPPDDGGPGDDGGSSGQQAERPRPRTGGDPRPALRIAAALLLLGVALLVLAAWLRDRDAESP